ncbi:MAG TPA: hypothetical protein VGT79_03420, partial [Xanthomonadaceae bacterium]|nr:hypothetical protein [Xanthomonadaceae bacterium]
ADLFADMLAEMPADAPLPDACTSAFAPIAEAHLSLCDTMKREFHATEAVMNQIGVRGATILAGEHGSRASDLFGSLLFNARASSAQSAVGAATFCSADPEIAAEDARMRTSQWWQVGGWQGALFNPVGGVLAAIARPSYNEYAVRMHELQRMDVLVRAAMAMRNNATQAKGGAVTAADVGALPNGVTFDAQHGQLRIKRAFYRADRSADFSIPLPASRLH